VSCFGIIFIGWGQNDVKVGADCLVYQVLKSSEKVVNFHSEIWVETLNYVWWNVSERKHVSWLLLWTWEMKLDKQLHRHDQMLQEATKLGFRLFLFYLHCVIFWVLLFVFHWFSGCRFSFVLASIYCLYIVIVFSAISWLWFSFSQY